MLEAARDTGRDIHFIHCARHAGVHAFRDWVEAQRAERPQLRHYVCYSEPREGDAGDAEGLLSLEQLAEWLPEQRDLDAYFLGPSRLWRRSNAICTVSVYRRRRVITSSLAQPARWIAKTEA